MGWLSDRFGTTVPVAIGTAMLALGLALASQAATMWQFTLVHGLLIRSTAAKPPPSPSTSTPPRARISESLESSIS
jgi:hypothetical protein